MKKSIVQTPTFKREVGGFLKKRLLLDDDFEEFQKVLIQNPEMGDIIVGTGGVRKARLKSASRGKSSGFRVCYYYVTKKYEIVLLMIYAKNTKADLNPVDKKMLKEIAKLMEEDEQ